MPEQEKLATRSDRKQQMEADFSRRLTLLMEATGTTIAQLAVGTGLSFACVAGIRNAKGCEPGFTVPAVIADYFAVPLDYLCGRMEEGSAHKVLEDYPRHFMEVRRASYEAYLTSRKKKVFPRGYEAPWPYNLVEELTGEPVTMVLRSDQEEGLECAIDSLKERERNIVRWYYRDGDTFSTVAMRWEVTSSCAQQILVRALKHLRYPARMRLILDGYDQISAELESELRRKRTDLQQKRDELDAELKDLDLQRLRIGLLRGRLTELETWDEDRKGLPGAGYPSYLDLPVVEMDLSTRAYNVLSHAGIKTLGQILESEETGRLKMLRNMGRKTHDEILDRIQAILSSGSSEGTNSCLTTLLDALT